MESCFKLKKLMNCGQTFNVTNGKILIVNLSEILYQIIIQQDSEFKKIKPENYISSNLIRNRKNIDSVLLEKLDCCGGIGGNKRLPRDAISVPQTEAYSTKFSANSISEQCRTWNRIGFQYQDLISGL